jgi:hypothetical protein
MANPTLGGATLPCPQSSSREYVIKKAEAETLGGTKRWDIMARKYTYVLKYQFVTVSEYEAIETKVNTLVPMTFIWDKYDSCATPGVSVLASVSTRTPRTPGNKDSDFYSEVTLTLEEVSSRI